MANQTGRNRQVSLAVLGRQIVSELSAQCKPPPEGAFTVYDVEHDFGGLKRNAICAILNEDKRLTSRIYRGKRYYWAKSRQASDPVS